MEPISGRPVPTGLFSENRLMQEAHFSSPKSDGGDLNFKLKKVLDSMQDSIQEVRQSVALAKELLVDTDSKLLSLQSQMVDIRTTVVEICTRKRSSGVAQLETRFTNSASSDKRLKVNLERTAQPTSGQHKHGSYEEEPSDSSFLSTVSENNHSADELKTACSDLPDNEAEIVTQAAQGSKGVLSPQDFLTFLYLSRQVDDPVQLARVSFTKHTTLLYYQLMTFASNLKTLNRTAQEAEGACEIDRSMEDKFQGLVDAFRSHMPQGD